MRAVPGLLLLAILTACAHQAKQVNCDKHLTPINPPTPVVKPDVAGKPTAP